MGMFSGANGMSIHFLKPIWDFKNKKCDIQVISHCVLYFLVDHIYLYSLF